MPPSTPIRPRSLPSAQLPDLTGTTVENGRLQLLALLGTGGFAKVYKAFDTLSSDYHAVKCLARREPGSRGDINLRHEIRNHTQVSHLPGVVTLHRSFFEGAYIFIVLELCNMDLHRLVIDQQRCAGRPDVAKRIFLEIVDALDACHAAGVSHRDLKPGNILCDADGRNIRLADFGVATRAAESTQFGVGTPVFASPESLDRDRESYSTRGADSWALGIIFIALLTSSLPWRVPVDSDRRFAAYRSDPANLLRRMLDLTPAFSCLLNRIFHPNQRRRPGLQQLRTDVLSMDRFLVGSSSRQRVSKSHPRSPHSSPRIGAIVFKPNPMYAVAAVVPPPVNSEQPS
ncbi:unnamed protein product, partial [Mycena citricolor]